MQTKRQYLSYLLRLWQESNGDPALWRASLEIPQSGDRLGFASMVDLIAFLEKETGPRLVGLEQVIQEENVPPSLLENREGDPVRSDAKDE